MVERKECVVLGNRFRLVEQPCLPSPFICTFIPPFNRLLLCMDHDLAGVLRRGLWMGAGGADAAPNPWSPSSEAVEEVK